MTNMAVLIDLDNVRPKLEVIEQLCAQHGRLVERRAFSNTPSVLAAYGGSFRQFGYRFELTPGLDPVPQEVDGLLVRTALELIEQPRLRLGSLAIVSNDNGYAELLAQLKARGLKTLVLGNQPGKRLVECADVVESLGEVLRAVPLGIDLGTTNTVVGLATQTLNRRWNVQQMEVKLQDSQGALVMGALIPSSVRFGPQGVHLGENVRSQYHAFRSSTILAWKDDIGRSQDDVPFCYSLQSSAPQAGTRAAAYLEEFFRTGRVAPEEAAAAVLSFCRQNVEERFPGRVKGVVITHPASYEADAVEATRRAACLAGWSEDEVVLLSEPHAALYHFLHQLQEGELGEVLDVGQPRTLAVYDLGGGTLDVSLHTVRWDEERQRFDVQDLAIGSRTRVGGNRVDELLVDHVLRRAPIPTLSPSDQEQLRAELLVYAERFKKLWGAGYDSAPSASGFRNFFQGSFLQGRVPIRCPIEVSTMREILAPLLCEDLDLDLVEALDIHSAFDSSPFLDRLDTLVVPVLELLLKARQRLGCVPQVEAVLLNGGMTYFPLVRERLARLLGPQTLLLQSNPDYAVARGAALYAAGVQGQAARRINPTDISLEVKSRSGKSLMRLVAQGQAFPYRTVIRGLRVPPVREGELGFPVWVGMGTTPGRGTTMQRFRSVPLSEVQKAGLAPGEGLDLEVDYGFDERLRLTLVHPTRPELRFPLEVGVRDRVAQTSGAVPKVPALVPKVPPLARRRSHTNGVASSDLEPGEWTRLAADLQRFPSDKGLWDRFRRLEAASAVAANRDRLAAALLAELRRCPPGQATRLTVLLRASRGLVGRFASDDQRIRASEAGLASWMEPLVRNLEGLSPNLIQELAETPGKLLWAGWGHRLLSAHMHHQGAGWAVPLLNSVGKCGDPDEFTLHYLQEVLETHRSPAHREKAAWALGRLLAPGQPEPFRASARLAFRYLEPLLGRLQRERELKVLPSVLGAIFQIASRHLVGEPVPASLRERLLLTSWNLKDTRLPEIRKGLQARLADLKLLLNLEQASLEDTRRIEAYLLELARD